MNEGIVISWSRWVISCRSPSGAPAQLDNPMDIQERQITNSKCRDISIRGFSDRSCLLQRMTVGVVELT
ncbi:hypothetical protein J6590_044799 [Homalodisca vitripennis]|nr:hypothetical protein J6590_044799 [Homalodisca vitripennis]